MQVLTKEFNQLSGTMLSVRTRIVNLTAFLESLAPGPERRSFLVALIETALNNAVEMMIETSKFGYPVAMVLTSMFGKAPELAELFRGMVKSAQYGCPLCVPQFTAFRGGAKQLTAEEWKAANGFKCAADARAMMFQRRFGGIGCRSHVQSCLQVHGCAHWT